MSDLTEKQREALEALADFMDKHEIEFLRHGCECILMIEENKFDYDYADFFGYGIREFLEKKEPTSELFEGTLDDLNNLGIRK